ncbi:MAG TPA: YdiU family protein [Pseudomonadales bacterium]|nr:YdiU family protein [Pseudomonadales bacterium]
MNLPLCPTRFAALGETFYSPVRILPLRAARWAAHSPSTATLLGLDIQDLATESALHTFNGILPTPFPSLAMVYSGHQFGYYNPRLGDGRALLLGEIHNADQHFEIQLKGAGPTPYSRQGDGRAVLRSSIREFLCSEAMHGLGIPTTRALALITSEEPVYREQTETGAMVIRVSPSHIRFGSFEYFFYTQQHDALQQLADFVIDNHYPTSRTAANPYADFLQQVVTRTARLMAHWQSVGFAHGVMNTDNMSILGETFDYGPFGFLDDYNPEFICNHSDHTGRYAFNQQPSIGLWNCNALAHALSPLIPIETLRDILGSYQPTIEQHYLQLMRTKLGLQTAQEADTMLFGQLLTLMQQSHVDYTILFRRLCSFSMAGDNAAVRDLFIDREGFDRWANQYIARLSAENSIDAERCARMKTANPKFILRNYLAQQAIELAQKRNSEKQQDFSEVENLLQVLQNPFDEHLAFERYAAFPPDWGKHLEISCSS